MEGLRAEQGVGNICDETLRTLYRTKFHVQYTHKQACKDDNECDNRSKLGRQALFAECISNNFGSTHPQHVSFVMFLTEDISLYKKIMGQTTGVWNIIRNFVTPVIRHAMTTIASA